GASVEGMLMRNRTIRRFLSMAGALAACAIFTPAAFPQARINNGNVLDANNRIGSGGYNTGGGNNQYRGPYVGYTAQDVITGNVTGGQQFRGVVPYRDPYSF